MRRLAFCDGKCKVRIWNLETDNEDQAIDLSDTERIIQMAWQEESQLDIAVHCPPVCKLYTCVIGQSMQSEVMAEGIDVCQHAAFSPATQTWAVFPDLPMSNQEKLAIALYDKRHSMRSRLVGHQTTRIFFAWHPDGKLLATSCADRTLRIWDTQTARQLASFRLATGGQILAWNPQGTKVAAASGNFLIVDYDETKVRPQLPPNTPSFSISPDGRHIALGHLGKDVRVWDMLAARELTDLALPAGQLVRRVAYSPDGTMLAATVGDERTVVVWDVASRKAIGTYVGDWNPRNESILSWSWVIWSPDSTRLAAVGPGTSGVHVFRPSGERITILPCSPGRDTETWAYLGWNRLGSKIVSIPGHHFAELLDIDAPGKILCLDGHKQWERSASWLWRASFSPNGARVVTSSLMGTLRIWDVATGAPIHTLASHEADGCDVAWSPDGARLASGDSDGELKIWDVKNGNELLSLSIGRGGVNQLDWTPDGSRIIAHVYGAEHLVILDANASYLREHAAAGRGRIELELRSDPKDIQGLLQLAEINLRKQNWSDVLRDANEISDTIPDSRATGPPPACLEVEGTDIPCICPNRGAPRTLLKPLKQLTSCRRNCGTAPSAFCRMSSRN
jgi:WD40 repeat protein